MKKILLLYESYKMCSLNDPASLILMNVVLWLPRCCTQEPEPEIPEPKPENPLEKQRDFVGKEQLRSIWSF